MVDWGWVKPIERYLAAKNTEQQDSGLPERYLLARNTEQQGNDAFRLGGGTVLDDLHHAAVDQRQRKSRRSPYGWTWTCSDLALIINKYDGVIGLLEEINNFIRETFLGALEDQLSEEVRELVSEALGIFTESEEQLKASKEPLVQHQSALGCSSESSSATMPTEGGFLSNTEVDTTPSPTVNVTEIAQAVVTLSIDYLIILQEIDASTFPKYAELRNLSEFLDSLINTLNNIIALENRRSANLDCETEMSRKVLFGEASEFITSIVGITETIGINTGIASLDRFLPELRVYLVNVMSTMEPFKNRIDNKNCVTTTNAATSNQTTITTPSNINMWNIQKIINPKSMSSV